MKPEDLAAIQRRQQIAQRLMAQSQKEEPTNQMAGGYVIPYSPLQGFAKIGQQIAGALIAKDADKKESALRQQELDKLREINLDDPNAYKNLMSMGMPKEALALKVAQSRQARSNYFQPTNQVVLDENGQLRLKRYGSDPNQPAIIDDSIMPNNLRWIDKGDEFVPVPTKGTLDNQAPKPTQTQSYGNNPGNIRPIGQSTGFQSYESPSAGIKAIDDNLLAYANKHGINTLEGVISRWSPPNENDTSTLIDNASKRLGIAPNAPIDLTDPVQRHAISTAIMMQENPIFAPKKKTLTPAQVLDNDPAHQAEIVRQKEAAKLAEQNEAKLVEEQNKKQSAANLTKNTLERALGYLYPKDEQGNPIVTRDQYGRLVPPEQQMIYGGTPTDRVMSTFNEWTNTPDEKKQNLESIKRIGKQLVLDATGGKLGAQISNADVAFLESAQGILSKAQNINEVYQAFSDIEEKVNQVIGGSQDTKQTQGGLTPEELKELERLEKELFGGN